MMRNCTRFNLATSPHQPIYRTYKIELLGLQIGRCLPLACCAPTVFWCLSSQGGGCEPICYQLIMWEGKQDLFFYFLLRSLVDTFLFDRPLTNSGNYLSQPSIWTFSWLSLSRGKPHFIHDDVLDKDTWCWDFCNQIPHIQLIYLCLEICINTTSAVFMRKLFVACCSVYRIWPIWTFRYGRHHILTFLAIS